MRSLEPAACSLVSDQVSTTFMAGLEVVHPPTMYMRLPTRVAVCSERGTSQLPRTKPEKSLTTGPAAGAGGALQGGASQHRRSVCRMRRSLLKRSYLHTQQRS